MPMAPARHNDKVQTRHWPTPEPTFPDQGSADARSIAELRNSYRDVLGVVPKALDDIPPDSLGLTFDRVVNAQTVSAAHLDGFAAAAREAVTTLVAEKTLDERVPACSDDILPPLAASVRAEVPGTGLAAGPEWAIQPTDVPDALFIQYATEVTLSYAHLFPAPGSYVVICEVPGHEAAGMKASLVIS